jgi:predicted amidohydrolase YtcJ
MHHWIKGIGFGLALSLLASCGQDVPERAITADSVYIGGTILTMNATNDTASAVAVLDGRIVAIGHDDDVLATVGEKTTVVDLAGKTMLPGFIDAHGHFPYAGDNAVMRVDLQSPPMGPVTTMAEMMAALAAKAANTPKGGWIMGMGYDDTLVAEMRHPTKADLDAVSTEHKIFILHTSMHMAVGNTAVLDAMDITADTPAPEGGVIELGADGEPNGLLKESAMWSVMPHMPPPSPDTMVQGVETAGQIYASQGVTTAQVGLADPDTIERMNDAAEKGRLPIRVIVWPGMQQAATLIDGSYKPVSRVPEMVTIGAVKIIGDGSIQGYTGYLGEPYHVQPDGETDFDGFPAMPAEDLKEMVMGLHGAGFQLAVHGNGDAAIDDILNAFEAALAANPNADARPIIIHAQMAREDQLDRMKELGVSPSFFSLHTYYWGDRHRDIFMGPERAFRMSPAKSAIDKGIPFTIHADTPVTPMEPLRLAWSATNRISTGGNVIGEAQRITALQALRATTIDAAWQSFLEDDRGSIETGKRADFVILADNPLLRPDTMDSIRILETIVGGETVYVNESAE